MSKGIICFPGNSDILMFRKRKDITGFVLDVAWPLKITFPPYSNVHVLSPCKYPVADYEVTLSFCKNLGTMKLHCPGHAAAY